MAIDAGTAIAYLDLDVTPFQKGMSTAMTSLRSFTDSSLTASQRFSALGSSMASAGGTLSKTVTLPIVGIGIAATKVAGDFEGAMSKVKAISGATGDEMSKLRDKAIEMGAKTKFSAKESADAFTFMAMAGWDAGQMIEGIGGIMDLAAADGLDLATTSDIVTDALTAFGLQAKDSGHFADVLAQASSSCNTNVSLLGESFKYVAPVAGALGMSAEDTALALGLMANAGVKGSQSGTALRSSLTNLVKPTDNMAAKMEELGISATNSDGSMKSLKEIIIMLREKFAGLTEAEQANAAATIFGKEAMSGMLAIINTSEADFNKLAGAIENADGRAGEMADTMMDNLPGAIEQMKGAFETLLIRLGTALIPVIRDITEFITKIVEWLNTLSDKQVEQIVRIAAIVAAIGPVLLIVGKVITAVSSIIGVVTKVGGAIKGIIGVGSKVVSGVKLLVGFIPKVVAAIAGMNPVILIIIAAITALIAIGVALYKNWDKVKEVASNVWNGVEDVVGGAIEGIKGFLSGIVDFISNNWQGLLLMLVNPFIGGFKLLYDNCEGFRNFIDNFVENVKTAFGNMLDAVGNFFSNVGENISKAFETVKSAIGNFISSAVEGISNAFNQAKDFIINNITVAGQAALAGLKVIFDGIVNIVVSIKDAIVNFFSTMWATIVEGAQLFIQTVSNVISTIVETVRNIVQSIVSIVSEIFATIVTFVQEFLSNLITLLTTAWDNIVATVTALKDRVVEIVTTLFEKAKEIISTFFENVKEFVSQALEAISQGIKDFFEKIKEIWNTAIEFLKNLLKETIEFVTNLFKEVQEAVSNLVQAIIDKFSSFLDFLKKLFTETIPNIFKSLVEKFQEFRDAIVEKFEAVKKVIQEFFDKLISLITEKLPEAIAKIKDFMLQFFNAIKEKLDAVISAVLDFGKRFVSSAIKFIKGFVDNFINGIKILPQKIKEIFDSIVEFIKSLISRFAGAGEEAGNGFLGGLQKAWEGIKNFFSNIADFGSGIFSGIGSMVSNIGGMFNGSHANGLDYVPYNNYVAQLHQGERVLTKQEAEEYNSDKNRDSGGDVYNFYNTKPDPYEYARQMKRVKKELEIE